MTLEIIGIPRSNFVRTVRMVAEEKSVPYNHISANPHSDEVKAINPLGQVPVMRHDGLELSESQAIARYIDTAFEGPALVPTTPREAAPVNQWIAATAVAVDQLFMRNYVVEYAFHKDENGNVVRTKIDKALKRFPRMIGMLEKAVAPGYLGTASFSMADCFLVPILNAIQLFPEGEEAFGNSETLKTYFDRVTERASFIDTTPPA
jgi:glutathione S-transferase